MKLKSDYTSRFIGGVLVIEDLNLGRMSVTNNIENILEEISIELNDGFTQNTKIIYRDSDGMWDGIKIESASYTYSTRQNISNVSYVISFIPIQTIDLQTALKFINNGKRN